MSRSQSTVITWDPRDLLQNYSNTEISAGRGCGHNWVKRDPGAGVHCHLTLTPDTPRLMPIVSPCSACLMSPHHVNTLFRFQLRVKLNQLSRLQSAAKASSSYNEKILKLRIFFTSNSLSEGQNLKSFLTKAWHWWTQNLSILLIIPTTTLMKCTCTRFLDSYACFDYLPSTGSQPVNGASYSIIARWKVPN